MLQTCHTADHCVRARKKAAMRAELDQALDVKSSRSGRWTHPPTGARASPLGCADRTGGQLGHTGKAGSVTKQNTPAPQWRPGPSKAEMRKQIEAAMARTAALPIKKLPPERRPKLGKRKRLIRG